MCFAGHPVLTGVLNNCQNVFQPYISGNIKATKMVLTIKKNVEEGKSYGAFFSA